MLARIRKSLENREEGFTLIELLVVVIIIGILAAIAIPVFLNQRKKAVDSSIKSDLKTVADSEETYAVDNQTAPYVNVAATLGSPKMSSGNHIEVAVDGTKGYCVRGSNSRGTGGTTAFFWYDSENGGLASGGSSGTAPTGSVACAGTPTFADIQAGS